MHMCFICVIGLSIIILGLLIDNYTQIAFLLFDLASMFINALFNFILHMSSARLSTLFSNYVNSVIVRMLVHLHLHCLLIKILLIIIEIKIYHNQVQIQIVNINL